MASIVTANVFTLFNAILGVFFFVLVLLGQFADATFGLIAVINTAIGIRQELKAKETLTSSRCSSPPGRAWSATAGS